MVGAISGKEIVMIKTNVSLCVKEKDIRLF